MFAVRFFNLAIIDPQTNQKANAVSGSLFNDYLSRRARKSATSKEKRLVVIEVAPFDRLRTFNRAVSAEMWLSAHVYRL